MLPERSLFDPAIFATTPWYNDIQGLMAKGSLDDPENEAPLLGAWWALADWCRNNEAEGACYDLAAAYIDGYFSRDPRTINTQTWAGAGAIGASLSAGYDVTASYLDMRASGLLPELMNDRPGVDWLCDPSCSAVLGEE